MPVNQQNSLPEEDETGLADLVVPAQNDEHPVKAEPAVLDPLAADRANRMAAIRAEAAAREAKDLAKHPNKVQAPEPSAALLAAAEERRQAELRANSSFKVSDNPQDIVTSWEEVVAKRQEAARLRRHEKEQTERADNQIKKEEFKAKILAARQPETTVHRPQPTAPAISAQTLAEMEAGRKRSEEYRRAKGAIVMPRVQ